MSVCPQNALFGMDIPTYDDGRIAGEFNILGGGNSDEIPFDDDYLEVSKGNLVFQKNMTVSLLFKIGFGGSTNIDGITVIRLKKRYQILLLCWSADQKQAKKMVKNMKNMHKKFLASS